MSSKPNGDGQEPTEQPYFSEGADSSEPSESASRAIPVTQPSAASGPSDPADGGRADSDARVGLGDDAPEHEYVRERPDAVLAGSLPSDQPRRRSGERVGEAPRTRALPVATIEDDDEDYEDEPQRRGFWWGLWGVIRELLIIVGLAMLLSFVVKTWLFQAFYIPSGSMEDTLVRDDRVIVSKLTPGPFDLQRGDVVVFEDPDHWLAGVDPSEKSTVGGPLHNTLVFVGLLPDDTQNHLIKRVIGLPGDRIQADGDTGKLKVNGVAIDEPYIKPGDDPSLDKSFDIVVPPGKVWVMGDHRSNSSDSRFHDDGTGTTGSVPIDKIVGRALFIVWPLDRVDWLGVPDQTFQNVPAPSDTKPVTPGSTDGATAPATAPVPAR